MNVQSVVLARTGTSIVNLNCRSVSCWLFFVLGLMMFSGFTDQCSAQRFTGFRNRNAINRNAAFGHRIVHQRPFDSLSLQRGPHDFGAVKRSGISFFESLAERHSYDRRIHRDADADSVYPRFIGGFHSSHFRNVGVPSGDIGFRGNGIYWTPW